MALQNLSLEQLSSLQSGKTEEVVEKLHKEVKTKEDGSSWLNVDYCQFWGLLRFALTAAKVFTPDKIDKKIDEIIAAGDATCPKQPAAAAPAAAGAGGGTAQAGGGATPTPPPAG
ncbi:MAG TPA: hypothetical protein VFQ45_23200 [Longimicrobium sp.]|nr:hypothetical protein [Longimicrobium sp.]